MINKQETSIDTRDMGTPTSVSIGAYGQVVILFEKGYIRTVKREEDTPDEVLSITRFNP